MGILGQNRKPDKVCPGNFFAQKLRNWIISLMPHNFSHFLESIKRYLEKGALKSLKSQHQQLSLFIDLIKINLRDQKYNNYACSIFLKLYLRTLYVD